MLENLSDTTDGAQLFREMTNGLPLIVWVHDHTGAQEMVNDTFCEFFGVTREEMRGGRWQALMHPDDADGYRDAFVQALEQQTPFHREVRVRRGDSAWRWIESWGRPRWTGAGEFAGIIGTSADITERKDAENALKQAQEALEEADRRKDMYLAMLGHELRNPISAIANATELVKHRQGTDMVLERAAGVLSRQTTHMTRLVDGLLDIARIASGGIDLRMERFDLDLLVAQTADDRRPLVRDARLVLDVRRAGTPVWVRADRSRVTQIVDNLLGNACKFTPDGGSIEVMVATDARYAVLSVRDSGVGIAADTLDSIFEPFHRGGTRFGQRGESGLGLGLTVVKQLVELQGGTIAAASDGVGHGARFTVRFPIAEHGQAPRPRSAVTSAPASSPCRILVVEDNADAAEMLSLLIETSGHRVTVAHRGEDALAQFAEADFDVVLCDLDLPGIDGYALATAIRVTCQGHVRLVAMTGHGELTDRAHAEQAGFDHLLLKPVKIDAIERAVSGARSNFSDPGTREADA